MYLISKINAIEKWPFNVAISSSILNDPIDFTNIAKKKRKEKEAPIHIKTYTNIDQLQWKQVETVDQLQ